MNLALKYKFTPLAVYSFFYKMKPAAVF